MKRLKNSVGIWAFGANATRFVPAGYHVEEGGETMVERSRRAAEGLGELVDGFEYHFPGEVDEKSVGVIQEALGGKDIYALALGTFNDPQFRLGTFVNPDLALRQANMEITKRGIDLAADLGAKFIIWPGGEGYNYNFQIDYVQTWEWFIDGIQAAVEYANAKGVTVLLEHKKSEPAMNILMRNIGMAVYTIHKVRDRGTDTTNLKINMDWQHLIMNGENLAEYAALLAADGLLGHHHANSGWGTFDDDNITGAAFFMQTLELAKILQRADYGSNGERVGADLFPYTEDQVAAVRRALLQWEFIWDLAAKIDDHALELAWRNKDAVRGQEIVYEVLGLDAAYIERIVEERSKAA
ncbi:TIM barrel protein [Candidatus Bipolaricaulota bacterium]|nr:TIM barrel protein [Candidatus Bipolaricaulota bacterium]